MQEFDINIFNDFKADFAQIFSINIFNVFNIYIIFALVVGIIVIIYGKKRNSREIVVYGLGISYLTLICSFVIFQTEFRNSLIDYKEEDYRISINKYSENEYFHKNPKQLFMLSYKQKEVENWEKDFIKYIDNVKSNASQYGINTVDYHKGRTNLAYVVEQNRYVPYKYLQPAEVGVHSYITYFELPETINYNYQKGDYVSVILYKGTERTVDR